MCCEKVSTFNRKFHQALLTGLFLITALILPTVQAQTVSGITVFEGARLIIGDSSEPVEDSVIIIENDRIIHVGRRGMLVPDGATIVNLKGKTIMPAIIDTHKHLSGEPETLIKQLRQFAYFGVGTVMSLGHDVSDTPFQIREQPVPGAARILTAGRGITMPEPGRSDAPYWVTNEQQGRMAVVEQARRKVNFIKIWVDDRDGQYEKLSPALYGAIIGEAHKNNLPVTVHIFTLDDAKELLRAEVDAFAHGVRDRDIDDEIIALFRQHPDVVVVPNLPDRGVAVDMGWLRGSIPPAELEKIQAAATNRPAVQQTFGIQARNLARLNNEGVRIAFGTDGSTVWAHHLEMEDMVAAGMTPAEVIVAATRNSAELLRLDDVGTLQAGKSADFIVLDANPLEDITNTRQIAAVYLRGQAVDRTTVLK